ncbi:hypothetical protein FACS189418_9130 [Clostridia bacterium]|nr:hypothetical protein FACS189418_9130 [Clostridia bacterium]
MALNLYQRAFGGQIVDVQYYRDLPEDSGLVVSEEDKDLILFSRLIWPDGRELLCADIIGPVERGNNMYVSVQTESTSEVNKAWLNLREGGKIHMDLMTSFFATLHGSLQDKFGINWMFTVPKEPFREYP